jgi:hypothetical protein
MSRGVTGCLSITQATFFQFVALPVTISRLSHLHVTYSGNTLEHHSLLHITQTFCFPARSIQRSARPCPSSIDRTAMT